MNFNQVTLMGRLTDAPVASSIGQGSTVAKFTLAINRSEKNVDFIPCQVFGKTAETMVKYLSKGDPVLLSGNIIQNQFTAKDGTKVNQILVLVQGFKFISTGKKKDVTVEETIEKPSAPF